MKRNILNSTGPAAVLAAFLLGLFLPAGARAEDNCSASPQVTAQALQLAAQALQDERGHPEWLRIMAFTDAPVVGADVRVTANGLLLVEAKAATNRQGEFPARIWRPWLLAEEAAGRSLVRISISGGTIDGNRFLGHLTADVAFTDLAHQILIVNPVTTLVSFVLDARPELELDKVEALVRRFLKLPANYSLGLGLRQGPHYVSPFFSPVVFLKEAQAAGGLDAFEHLLLRELLQEMDASPSAKHSFRPPQLLGSTGSSNAAQLLGSTADTSSAASVIQAGLYAGILDYSSNEGLYSTVGWALALVGVPPPGPDPTQAVVDALNAALLDLQSSISNLSSQVSQLNSLVQATATKTQYDDIVIPAQDLASTVCGVQSDLAYWAGVCSPTYIQKQKDNESYCISEKAFVDGEVNNLTIQQAYGNLEGYVSDNHTTGFSGMLHLYSLWLGQSKQFFRPADSTKMQNLYDYWDAALTEAANLKIELLHENHAQTGNPQQLTDFMGNPNATPPSTGIFQKNQGANLKLMWPPVPIDPPTRATTVISTQDHTMFALLPWVNNQNGASPAPGCSGYLNSVFGVTPYAGFRNWEQAPSKAQWQAAVSLAPTNTAWHDWLIQQTRTTDDEYPASPGFLDLSKQCPGGGKPIAGALLTSNSDCSLPAYPCVWITMDPYKNTFQNLLLDGSAFAWPARTLAAGEQYFWYQ